MPTLQEELSAIAASLCNCGMCPAGQPEHRAAINAAVRLLVDKLYPITACGSGDLAYYRLKDLLNEMKGVDL